MEQYGGHYSNASLRCGLWRRYERCQSEGHVAVDADAKVVGSDSHAIGNECCTDEFWPRRQCLRDSPNDGPAVTIHDAWVCCDCAFGRKRGSCCDRGCPFSWWFNEPGSQSRRQARRRPQGAVWKKQAGPNREKQKQAGPSSRKKQDRRRGSVYGRSVRLASVDNATRHAVASRTSSDVQCFPIASFERVWSTWHRQMQAVCLVLETRWMSQRGRLQLLPSVSRGRTQVSQKIESCCDADGCFDTSQTWKSARRSENIKVDIPCITVSLPSDDACLNVDSAACKARDLGPWSTQVGQRTSLGRVGGGCQVMHGLEAPASSEPQTCQNGSMFSGPF